MCGQQVALSATQGPHRAGPVDMLTCQGLMLLAIAFHARDLDVGPRQWDTMASPSNP